MGYEVKKGDGWYKIAKSQGIDVNELLALNNATLDTMLHPGQQIKTSKAALVSKKEPVKQAGSSAGDEGYQGVQEASGLPGDRRY